ncbi:MAG: hypothetical protein HFG20_06540 [Anaerotruncus sp.]|nr:hypothetical protein [Anaerotruncus sp.]
MEYLIAGIQTLLGDPFSWFLILAGVFMGIVFGCIPGLTATLGVILMIPVTYTMTPVQGLTLLVSIYVGGISGGLITAILINIPGTPSSLVTTWDGYPMAKNGRPDLALSIGVFASLIGGLVSAALLMFVAPQLSKITLSFDSWEYFSLSFLGISVVVSLTGKDTLKGILAAIIGLILGAVGTDSVTGLARLTFGTWQIQAGIASTALMMALFAVREIFVQTSDLGQVRNKMEIKQLSFRPPLHMLKGCWLTMAIGSLVGTFIGFLPGVGQGTAAFITYNQSKNLSKHPEAFGQGCPEGIVASESANNAVNGGALIPLLTLGIPGDMTTAALIGGLMLHGLQPGPLLFRNQPDLVGAVMVVYLITNLVMYLMELGLMRVFIRAVDVPQSFLFPAILLACLLGVFSLNNRVFDLWVMAVFGIVGYLFTYCDFPMPPMILGFILGPTVEKYFRTAMISSQGNFSVLLSRPVAFIFLLLSAVFILWPITKGVFSRYQAQKAS